MTDYVLRRRKGQWVQVDKAIVRWRKAKERRRLRELELAKLKEDMDKPKEIAKRDRLMGRNMFGNEYSEEGKE